MKQDPPPPSKEEIQERAAEIRAKWPRSTRLRRRVSRRPPFTIDVINTDHLMFLLRHDEDDY